MQLFETPFLTLLLLVVTDYLGETGAKHRPYTRGKLQQALLLKTFQHTVIKEAMHLPSVVLYVRLLSVVGWKVFIN